MSDFYYIGVDVGTNSVRCVAIDGDGHRVGTAVIHVTVHNPLAHYYEQSSDEIWKATCQSIRQVISENKLDINKIKSIGFDATCSLVVLDANGAPLSVDPADKDNKWNIIMWMDHRAIKQADEINKTNHSCLKSVGGKISLEMEPPKLLWLKENMPDHYAKAGFFMDLADFLTFKATGLSTRSLCCVVSKWLCQADEKGHQWDQSFYQQIGLSDLCDNNFAKIGFCILKPGAPCGSGLSAQSATLMSLNPGLPVATGIIDAYAGCLGIMHTKINDKFTDDLPVSSKLIMVCGTSTCHMTLSAKSIYVDGIWGPFYGSILPMYWTNEAGQNLVGPILETVVKQYGPNVTQGDRTDLHDRVRQNLLKYAQTNGNTEMIKLAEDIHVWPDYHGNRSPLAEPLMSGAIMGLKVESNVSSDEYFMSIYLAHIQSFALMTRFIIETLVSKGHEFQAIYLCGGLQKNLLYVQAHADACQLPVVLPDDLEPVARGAAVLGAFASTSFLSLEDAAKALSSHGRIIRPNVDAKDYFDKKYTVFRKLGDLMLQTINPTPSNAVGELIQL